MGETVNINIIVLYAITVDKSTRELKERRKRKRRDFLTKDSNLKI